MGILDWLREKLGRPGPCQEGEQPPERTSGDAPEPQPVESEEEEEVPDEPLPRGEMPEPGHRLDPRD